MNSTLVSKYDSHLKNYYYVDSSNGIISFDSPLEVKRSSSASSTSSKGSFFKNIPRKLNICQRFKSISSNNSDEHQQSINFDNKNDQPLKNSSDSSSNTYTNSSVSQPAVSKVDQINSIYQREDSLNNYTTTSLDQDSDAGSLYSIDSYVSSIDDQVVNHNAYQFYNSNSDSEQISPPTTISTTSCSSDCSGNANHYYYHYCKSEVSKSAHSLTIMNPDEFMTMRGNLDDYNHDEIESLHGTDQYPKFEKNTPASHEIEAVSYDRLSDSLKLLSAQLCREFNSFDDDEDDNI